MRSPEGDSILSGTTEEKVARYLNDEKFLRFLSENPDATEKSSDNEYLDEKIVIFEAVKSVKELLKKFVTVEVGGKYTDVVNDTFTEKLEGVAIHNPEEFGNFYTQVSEYLSSLNTLQTLIEKRKELTKKYEDATLASTQHEGNKPKWYSLNVMARRRHAKQATQLRGEIATLTEGGEANLENIQNIRIQIDTLKSGLRDNLAFKDLEIAFIEKVRFKIYDAMQEGNQSVLATEMEAMRERSESGNLFTEERYGEVLDIIREHAKTSLGTDTEAFMDKNETIKLTTFEKKVADMKKKGTELGLDEDECNERIRSAFERKITELQTGTDPQAKIKIILAKRIISSL